MRKKIAIILSCLTMISMCAFPACDNQSPSVSSDVVAPGQTVEMGGMVVGESEGESITLLTRKLAQAEYEEYGVAATAETAYTVTATVLPEDAGNKNLNWSVSFVDPSSDWAQGKSVEDYVSLSYSGKNAILSCLAAFGSQIQLTATSVENPTKSASCLVNYAMKIDSVYAYFGNMSLNLGGITEITFEVSKEIEGDGGGAGAGFHTGRVYTISDHFDCFMSIHPCSKGALDFDVNRFSGTTWSSLEGTYLDLMDGISYGTEIFFDYVHEICNWKMRDPTGLFTTPFAVYSADELLSFFDVVSCPWLFTVRLDIVGTYSSYTYFSDLKCVGAINSTPVESLALDYVSVFF